MFAADDVKIEIDRVVEIRQQIEHMFGDGDVILPFGVADSQRVNGHKFDDLETGTGNVKEKINRRDDDEHARDAVEEQNFASRVFGRTVMIQEGVLVEQFTHD